MLFLGDLRKKLRAVGPELLLKGVRLRGSALSADQRSYFAQSGSASIFFHIS